MQTEDVLPEDGLYQYLYEPGRRLEGGQQRRATDMIYLFDYVEL